MATRLRTGIATAALGLSLIRPSYGQQPGSIQPVQLKAESESATNKSAIYSVMEAHNGTNVTYNTNMLYDSLSPNETYALHASTNEHCYLAGIRFAEGKAKLFIRVEDTVAKSDPKRYGYDTSSNSQIKEGAPDQEEIETIIMRGGTVTAQLSINDGKVKISVVNNTDKREITLTSEDPADTFYWPTFHFPPSKSITLNGRRFQPTPPADIKPIVRRECENWIFR